MLSKLKDTRPILETMAHLGKSPMGKMLAEFLRQSYMETAQSAMYRTDPAEIYLQHGYMQCLNDLLALLRDAPDIIKQVDDSGHCPEGLPPPAGRDDPRTSVDTAPYPTSSEHP